MKAILIVGDGMSDRPLKELDGKTPLEAANTPNLDKVARLGVCGIMDIISPGIPPGSDVANLALIGYDPVRSYRGRGALEAFGVGITVSEGDVAFRGNFAYIEDGRVIDRRAGRIDGSIFKDYLSKIQVPSHPEVSVTVMPTLEHRLVVVLRGKGLSWRISDTDPHKDKVSVLKSMPLDSSKEAERTASIINELSEELMDLMRRHPINRERAKESLPQANGILLRGAGEPPAITPIRELFNIKGGCVSATPTVRGVCRYAGFDVYDAPGATGGIDTDTISKAKTAERILSDYDLVYIHVKGTDNASHDGNPRLKIRVIENIDKMMGHLLDHVDLEETYIAVTADHTTSCVAKDHRGDPVPVAVYGPEVRPDAVTSFSERSCATGGISRIRGMDLMPMLLDFLGKTKLIGS
ncbi:MAG: 2,3-bisphosphoglycerate-independent phosphoglycerate mutase [Candidatus Bathyarchaeia archaeon]